MKTTKETWVLLLLGSLLWVWLAGRIGAQTKTESDIAVVVHPETPVNGLTLAELRKIYRGERLYWKTGLPIVLLIRSQGTRERDVILRTVFQMREEDYKKFWVAKIMRAEAASAPVEIYSNGMIKEGVAGVKGAVGCMAASDLRPGIKVLRIDGHLPGEPGYPLR